MTISRTTVPDQVFSALVEAVLSGRYAPGERLPAQRTLAGEYGVNMASIREAIKRLEQMRLVEIRHGDAMRVRDWRASSGLDVLVHAIAGNPTLLKPLMEARRLLLTEAARLAATRRSDDEAALLIRLAAEIGTAPGVERLQELDFAFMSVLIEASRNLVFVLIMNSIRELYLSRREAFWPMFAAGDFEHYAGAAAAVSANEADEAAAAVATLAAAHEARLT